MQWLIDNKEWIFSGIGVFALSLIIGLIFRKKNSINQHQKSGAHSRNYQAGGDMKIGKRND